MGKAMRRANGTGTVYKLSLIHISAEEILSGSSPVGSAKVRSHIYLNA